MPVLSCPDESLMAATTALLFKAALMSELFSNV